MAKITEAFVKDKVKQIVTVFSKYANVYTFCPMTFGYGENGHPDRIIVVNGVFIGVEVKKDKNNHHSRPELKAKPNEVMQKKQAAKIQAAGGVWLCVHNSNLMDLAVVLCTVVFGNQAGLMYLHQEDRERVMKLVGV